LHHKIDTKAGYITVAAGTESRTCDDPTVANQIIEHFTKNDKSRKSYKCGYHTWWVGNCAAGSHIGLEICVDCKKICNCGQPGAVVLRPCINNGNWGGHGKTCGGGPTTLSLTTKAKEGSSMLSSAEFDQELEEDGDDSWMRSSDPALNE